MTDRLTGSARQRVSEPVSGFIYTATLFGALIVLGVVVQISGRGTGWADRLTAPIGVLWSQDWGFFADADTAISVEAYQGDIPTGDVHRLVPRAASAADGWGFDRSVFAINVESQSIDAALPTAAWVGCQRALASCLRDAGPLNPRPVPSPAAEPRICGPTVIAEDREKVGPGGTPLWITTRFAEVDVLCG